MIGHRRKKGLLLTHDSDDDEENEECLEKRGGRLYFVYCFCVEELQC
jgi:hypothetical protein